MHLGMFHPLCRWTLLQQEDLAIQSSATQCHKPTGTGDGDILWLGLIPHYPLVNIQKAIEHGHRNSGFTHKKLWFSMVMLVYGGYSKSSKVWAFLPSASAQPACLAGWVGRRKQLDSALRVQVEPSRKGSIVVVDDYCYQGGCDCDYDDYYDDYYDYHNDYYCYSSARYVNSG